MKQRLAFFLLMTALGQAELSRADELPTAPTPQPVRPGRFHAGPFYLTPRLQIDNIALDTNVFYTATDRRTDISAGGGPALDVVLPISGRVRLVSTGLLHYIYFVKTASERRLVGGARSDLEVSGARTSGALGASYAETFSRPEMEVDRRLDQTDKSVYARLDRRLFGRTSLSLNGRASRNVTDDGQEYLGTDLSRTLTRDLWTGTVGLEYLLTLKTRLRVEGVYEQSSFPKDHSRDSLMPRWAAGLRTDSGALIAGQAMVGMRWYRPEDSTLPEQRVLYANVDATWHISPRTHFGAGYATDLSYTSFETVSGAPTLHVDTWSAHVEKELIRNLDLQLNGRRFKYRTENAIRMVLPSGETVEEARRDIAYEASANLGYRFWNRLRIGALAQYNDRQSTISDFGVDGLLVGATVVFTP